MHPTAATELDQLRAAVAGFETQRAVLGDAVVDAALQALRQKMAALEAATPPFPLRAAAPETRRLISILFMDVVGSTTLAENMDPEDWRQIISQLMEALGAVIVRHHGRVAQYMGDGLLAFFGADQLRENDAENAIRAGLAMQAEVARLFDPAGVRPIRIRIGINSGPVVIGELGGASHKEFTAIGDAMNTAARIQSEAPVGGVLISHETYRHVRGVFDVTPRPAVLLKGKSQPVATYLVRRVKPRAFRETTRGVTGSEARTVGRAQELHALQQAYLDAHERGHVAWAQVSGIAGVGKSRLVTEFNSWIDLREETVRLLRARAVEGDERHPFALLRWMWFDRFQIADDAPLAQAEAKWVQKFSDLWGEEGDAVTERAHALGLLAGLVFKDSPHLMGLRNDPVQVKGRAFVVARELIDRLRQATPVVMQLEDLQWADASSCEWLAQLLTPTTERPAPPRGLLVLGTARLEWTAPPALQNLLHLAPFVTNTKPPLPSDAASPRLIRLSLGPLATEATHELVADLLQPLGTVPGELRDLIAGRAEGMPYYVEELVNWCFDHGIIDRAQEPWVFHAEKLRAEPLPVTLQHLLLTRLSALPEAERAALQHGAVFGRHFWTGGVQALGGTGAAALDALRPRGFVEPQAESSFAGEPEWIFYHGILRDVTYETVLKRDRATLHRQAAAWLEAQATTAGRLDEFSALLGEHYERAGEVSVAADWHLRAGDRARGRAAAPEARRAYTRALELIPRTDTERRWLALLGREVVLGILGDLEAWKADLAALQKIAEAPGQGARLAEVYYRFSEFNVSQGNYPEAIRLADLTVLTARGAGDTALELKAAIHQIGAATRSGQGTGAVAAAEEVVARARALGDPALLAAVLRRAVVCRLEVDRNYEAGIAMLVEQTEIDLRLGNRYTHAIAQLNMGVTYGFLGQYKLGRAALEESETTMASFGARRFRGYGLMNLGSMNVFATGDLSRGRLLLDQAIAEFVAVGDAWAQASSLFILGVGYEKAGDWSGAARRFAESLMIAEKAKVVTAIHDTLAGQARVALAQAKLDEAQTLATRVWDHLRQNGPSGSYLAALAYRTCSEVFDAAGRTEEAHAAATAGLENIRSIAAKLKNPAFRRSYLEDEPHNRALIQWGERIGVTTNV